MTWLAAALHRLADRIAYDPRIGCPCEQRGMQKGWKQRRNAEVREAALRRNGEPTSAAEMDAEQWRRFEAWIRERAA